MGNLLKEAACVVGIIYLIMHIAYGLISAIDSIKDRKRMLKEAMPFDLHASNRGKDAVGQEAISTEQEVL